MKTTVYFVKTNSHNAVVYAANGKGKMFDGAPTGIWNGVDLCADDAAAQLKKLDYENDFSEMPGDEFDFSPYADDVSCEVIAEIG